MFLWTTTGLRGVYAFRGKMAAYAFAWAARESKTASQENPRPRF
jgi:hypothetical protein